LTVLKSQVIEIAFTYNKTRHHRCARHLIFYFLFSLQKVKNKKPKSARVASSLIRILVKTLIMLRLLFQPVWFLIHKNKHRSRRTSNDYS